MKRKLLAASIIGLSLSTASLTALAGEEHNTDGMLVEAATKTEQLVRQGKIEGALLLDENLNNFTIDVGVTGSEATLSGNVNSSAEKSLAEEIALATDGIESVNNELHITHSESKEKDTEDASVLMDAAITAKVKASLLANKSVAGMDINVDTDNRRVTLKGEVDSEIESDLAEKITENISDVESVNNELIVASS